MNLKRYEAVLLCLFLTLCLSCRGLIPENPSDEKKADAPAAPTELTVDALTSASTKLQWNDNSEDETHFTIQRSLLSDFSDFSEMTTEQDEVSYVDKNLTTDTTYYYRVAAGNGNGRSEWSDTVSVDLLRTLNLPDAPSGLDGAVTGSTEVALSWIDNSDNETTFSLQYSQADDFSTWEEEDYPADAVSAEVSGLENGKTYFFRLAAINDDGRSPWSNTISLNMTQTPPAAPDNLNGTVTGPTEVSLSWTDNSGNEESFLLQYSQSEDFDSLVNVNLPEDATSTTINGLASGKDYYFRLQAVNGEGTSEWSGTLKLNLPVILTKPDSPNGLTATALSVSQIQLDWNDQSDNETSFVLERSESNTFSTVHTINIPGSNIESYTDTGLGEETEYFYRLAAVNGEGYSPWTATASAETDALPEEITVRVTFEDGIDDGPNPNNPTKNGGQKVYTIWITNEDEGFFQNINVCTRINLQNLTGIGLPYWQNNIRPHFTQTEIDAVTTSTIKDGDFVKSALLADPDLKKFTVYLELDHSFVGNDWFGDQPAILYAAEVDMEDGKDSYDMEFIGWTPNSNITSPLTLAAGTLCTILGYITQNDDGSGGFSGDAVYPATLLTDGITVDINP